MYQNLMNWPILSYGQFKPDLSFFLSGRLRQVLLYCRIFSNHPIFISDIFHQIYRNQLGKSSEINVLQL